MSLGGQQLFQPPLPAGPPPQLPPQQLPPPQSGYMQPQQPPQPLQQKRKKRGKRGSGLEARQRALKRTTQELGFFGQVPSLQDLRQENWRRTQQHYGGPPRAFQQAPGQPTGQKQQHGPGRSGSHRRSRSKSSKQPKFPQPTPRPVPLTPAAGNPLDTPANVGKVQAVPAGGDRLEAEGLAAGLDWYGTNENAAALFLAGAGQQMTTSDSDYGGEDYGGEDELSGDDGAAAAAANGRGVRGAAGGAGEGPAYDDAALPAGVRARLVEQEAYIAELEDQNLRLREQLDMLQQEVDELRGGGRGPADSEEGFAEHSEGSLPGDSHLNQGDLSVMQHHNHGPSSY